MARRFASRGLVTFVIFTFSSTFGCSTWRPMPTTDITSDEATGLVGKRVKFYTDDGVQTMKVTKVDFPYIYGVKKQRVRATASRNIVTTIEIRIDLRKVHRVEIKKFSHEKTAVFVLGSVVILGIALWASLPGHMR